MGFLDWVSQTKQNLGIGNANYIPGINFGTGSPPPNRQVLGQSTQNTQPQQSTQNSFTSSPYVNAPSYSPANTSTLSSGPTPGPGPGPNPGGYDPGAEARRIAEEQARVDLENAMMGYRQYEENATAQIGDLGKEKEGILSGYGLQRERAEKTATTATTEAREGKETAKGKALSTAQDVTKGNRNVLRALGILSSSAAGEMLSKPMTEFGTQAADLEQGFIKRKEEVQNWLMDRGKDIDLQVNQVNDKFTSLISQIQRDIRFNGEQRAAAVREATVAKQSTLAQIRQESESYQQAANQYKADMLGQIAQIQISQNPQADISAIMSQMIQLSSPDRQSQQAQIYQPGLSDEEKRKQQSQGILSGQ